MRIIKVVFENGYVANYDNEHIYIMNDDYTDSQLGLMLADDFAYFCENNVLGTSGYDFYDGWESEEAEQDYYDSCSWYPEEITLEELKEWCQDTATDDNWIDTYNDFREQLGLEPIEKKEEEKKKTYRVKVYFEIDVDAWDPDEAMESVEYYIKNGYYNPDNITWEEV